MTDLIDKANEELQQATDPTQLEWELGELEVLDLAAKMQDEDDARAAEAEYYNQLAEYHGHHDSSVN